MIADSSSGTRFPNCCDCYWKKTARSALPCPSTADREICAGNNAASNTSTIMILSVKIYCPVCSYFSICFYLVSLLCNMIRILSSMACPIDLLLLHLWSFSFSSRKVRLLGLIFCCWALGFIFLCYWVLGYFAALLIMMTFLWLRNYFIVKKVVFHLHFFSLGQLSKNEHHLTFSPSYDSLISSWSTCYYSFLLANFPSQKHCQWSF